MENVPKKNSSSPAVQPSPEKPYLGGRFFPTEGELLEVEEVIRNFENSPTLPPNAQNPNFGKEAVVLPPLPKSSTITEPSSGTLSGDNFGANFDPRKLKRMVANRVSAQRSRQRKQEYIEKLKRDIQQEEAKISFLSPQVSYYQNEREKLQKENEAMKKRFEALENDKIRKEGEFHALRAELEELCRVYSKQLQSKEKK